MPMFAPFITAAIGLTGVAATVGNAVIGIGLSVGASYLARRLQPKQSSVAPQGTRLSVGLDTNEPRELPFGLCASAGYRKYFNIYGPNGNDYLQLVFKLGDIACTSLEGLFVNGKACTLGSSVSTADVSGRTVTEFPNAMWVEFHNGAWDQIADPDLVSKASGGSWPSTYRGRGVCYVRVTLKYDAELFKDGLPRFLWVFKGAKLYDVRKDSTAGGSGSHRWGVESTYEWSDNASVALYNYLRGMNANGKRVGGMSVPTGSLPSDSWIAAANACDESVSLKAGGTERRYRLNGIVPVATEHLTVIRDFIGSMAGTLIDSGGVFKPQPGVAKSPVMSFTDEDLMARDDIKFLPKLSRGGLVNAVFGSFSDPNQKFETVSLPPRISPADEAADGGIQLAETYGLTFVSSGTQGQRIQEILRRAGRYQRRVNPRLRQRFAVLEAGDWVTWTSARYGFVNMTFEVMQSTLGRDLAVPLELKETSSAIHAWSPSTDELDPLAPATVASGGSSFNTVSGIDLDSVIVPGLGAQQKPGLQINWTPVSDKTVVSLELEYRKVGDTVSLGPKAILNPAAGTYTWVDGVQGGLTYEARLRPVTRPTRSTTWSSWVSSASLSPPQVVAVAAFAQTVDPAGIPPAVLDAQSMYELGLITEADGVLGSVSQMVADAVDKIDKVGLAAINALLDARDANASIRVEQRLRNEKDISLASQITTVQATLDNSAAQLQQQLTAIATDLDAQVTLSQTLTTKVDSNTAQVIVLAESIDGISGRFGVAVTANGEVLGVVQLDASATAGSSFTVVVDNFKISKPGVSGGTAVPVFALRTVNGVTKLALRGDMIADGDIAARHLAVATLSAISANLGLVTAGTIRDAANVYQWLISDGTWKRTDNTWIFDAKNKIIDITF